MEVVLLNNRVTQDVAGDCIHRLFGDEVEESKVLWQLGKGRIFTGRTHDGCV